jgi:hypothetical protein
MENNNVADIPVEATAVPREAVTLFDTIKEELTKTIRDFTNELELLFEYVDKSTIQKMEEFREGLSAQASLDKFASETVRNVKDHEAEMTYVMFSKHKLKSQDFKWLDNIVLCDNLIRFDVFKNENKNTKKSIVQYVYNMYMSCTMLQLNSTEFSMEGLTSEVNGFVENMQQQLKDRENMKAKASEGLSKHKKRANKGPSGNGFEDIFQSIFENAEIMNIATDITKDLQHENIDPMTLLSSMMSGRPNNQVSRLVENISSKLEQKLTSGDLNKDDLEKQAQKILETVQTSDITSHMPMLNTLLKSQFKK